MDDQFNTNIVNENESTQQLPEETELSHSDKLVGIITEPSATFEKMAKFPPRVQDWLFPVILLIVLSIASNLIIMRVPKIRYQMQQKQVEMMEKNLDEQVAKGNVSREQADQQIETTRNMMEKSSGGIFAVIQIVSTLFSMFIIFFIVSLVYFALSKLVLKGDGTYASAMSAYGMTWYISAISVVIMTIGSLALGRYMMGTSIASFLDMDRTTAAGYLLGKLDVLSIWALFILAIGLSKMFKSADTKKYILAVFSLWIVWSLFIFGIAQAVPMLKSMLVAL